MNPCRIDENRTTCKQAKTKRKVLKVAKERRHIFRAATNKTES